MKPDIVECLKLIRLLRRIFGSTDLLILDPEERRVIRDGAMTIHDCIAPFLTEDQHVQ